MGSADPGRLRDLYATALDVHPDPDGFAPFGPVGVLMDKRDDVAARTVEPGRVILNYHVTDIQAHRRNLDELGSSGSAMSSTARTAGPGSAPSPTRTATTCS